MLLLNIGVRHLAQGRLQVDGVHWGSKPEPFGWKTNQA